MFDDLWESIESLTDELNVSDSRLIWESNVINQLIDILGEVDDYIVLQQQDPFLINKLGQLATVFDEWSEVLSARDNDRNNYYQTMSKLTRDLRRYETAVNNMSLAELILVEQIIDRAVNKIRKTEN